MGIKNLNKLLIENDLIQNYPSLHHFTQSENKKITIAIDTNLYYYKYLKSSLQNPFYGFLIQIKNLRKNNIVPIYILDGKSPVEKTYLIEKRKKNNNVYIPYKDIKYFFDLLHIQYIHSNIESDKLIGILYDQKTIDYCLTDDLDILLYKCENIISIKKGKVYKYNLTYILQKLNITYKKFIYLCILMGCDYVKPKLNICYNEILCIIKNNEIELYQQILLEHYSKKNIKINYIFSIIQNIYLLFDHTDFKNDKYMYIHKDLSKTEHEIKFSFILQEMKKINNSFINDIPYSLLKNVFLNFIN